MKKQTMHVAIMDSDQSRKNVLEAAVSSIQCLKDFERLSIIRKQKKIYREELIKNINEINRFFSGLDVPKVDYEDKKIIKRLKTRLPTQKELSPVKTREIKKLEDDIMALRQKISNL
nr:hypothetical protein [Candidatus Woesearchaeota archaeon]